MVMEASPSPQSVGREFVRQYYTLLNKAPAHLHRFYNNYSSFVHGGLDAPNRETPPVIGQKQIHNRIQQLNFRDCHAKISQVDSQATLGNGVVVQVTGELSNGGAPMRRFTQTFVLAAQSPKKYYVHNDIFRYQDIVFSEEEGEGDGGRSEGEEEAGAYFAPAAVAAPASTPAPAPEPFPPAPPAPLHPLPPPPPPQHARAFDINCLSHLNGHDDNTGRQLVAALQGGEVEMEEEVSEMGTVEPEPEPEPEREASPAPAAAALPPPPPEPKTYANLLKSGGASHAAPLALQPRTHTTQPSVSAPEPAQPRASRPARAPRVDNPPPLPAEAGAGAATAAAAGAGGRRYSDSQQLFLGNLPHTATEEELRAVLGRFGAIAELRVHAKQGGAPLPGGRNPNYGFITYEEAQSAQNCLNAGPLYFPADGPDACKLNVEEKKARARGGEARGGRGGGARPLPSHRPPFPSRAPPALYRR